MPSSFWGVLSGGGLGFALGGPLGALLGAVAGHVLIDREGAPFGPAPRELIFTTGLVALSAKMARSDGVVTRDEVAAFQRIVTDPGGAAGADREPVRPRQADQRRLRGLCQPDRRGASATSRPCSRTCWTACS